MGLVPSPYFSKKSRMSCLQSCSWANDGMRIATTLCKASADMTRLAPALMMARRAEWREPSVSMLTPLSPAFSWKRSKAMRFLASCFWASML